MKRKYTVAEMLANHRGRKHFNCYDDMETAYVDYLLAENKKLRAAIKEIKASQNVDIHELYDVPKTTLCSGDKLLADTLEGRKEYEFVGLDLQDLTEGVGCRYMVLQPTDDTTGEKTYVEAPWFYYRKASLKGGE